MEVSFWFTFVGLTIYGLHHLWHRYPVPLTWLIDILAGAGIGALIGQARPVHFGYSVVPVWLTAFSGGLSAVMLWGADRLKLFEKQPVQYSLMIMMSIIHASIFILMYKWYILSQLSDYLSQPQNFTLFVHILLISALSFIGFTFPKRLLKIRGRD